MIGVYRKFTLDHVFVVVFCRNQTEIEIRKFHKIYPKNLELPLFVFSFMTFSRSLLRMSIKYAPVEVSS